METVVISTVATGYGTQALTNHGLAFVVMPDSDGTYALVGRVAAWGAHIDNLLDRMIWALMGVDPEVGAQETSRLVGASQRWDRVVNLAEPERLPNDLLSEALRLQGRSPQLSKRRARIIHDPWFLNAQTGRQAQFRAMPKGQLVFGFVEVEPTEVDATVDELMKTAQEVGALHDRVLAHLVN